MSKVAKTHSLERTSPKGTGFVGRCVLCGVENLSIKDVIEVCNNPKKISSEEALLGAVRGNA